MKYIVTEPQLSIFLRRRFTAEDLYWIVNDVKHKIEEEGIMKEMAIYGTISQFIVEKFPNLETHSSYKALEAPLTAFIKLKLSLD
jgi:hypothetical protein